MTDELQKLNHTFSRRSFLKLFSISLLGGHAAACSHKKFFNPDEDIVLSGGSFSKSDKLQNALVVINLIQKDKKVIETDFLPHGIYINPNNKYSIFCFEKNGINACEIDIQTQKIIRTVKTEQNWLFSGHASFSVDGKKIICIEKDKGNYQGSITIRHTDTFEIIQRLPTLGLSPHDCQVDTDNILTVSNTGRSESGFHQPSLVRINLDTGKLVERIKLDTDDLNCGHFISTKNNELVIASAPVNDKDKDKDKIFSGGVSIRNINENMTTMTEPAEVIKHMTGEALSIEVDERRSVAAVTHPEANLLTFWSIKDKRLLKVYAFENPRGLSKTLDKKYFIVSYGNNAAMEYISTNDLSPQTDSIVQPTHASGEHILNWSKTLHEIMPERIYD